MISATQKNVRATPTATADQACVHRLFETRASETPAAIALQFGERVVSYAELDERASRLAAHLRSVDVHPERLVGLLMPRGINMIVAMLGILKAGGAYVPLDPSYPAERLRFMAADADLSVLLTTDGYARETPLDVANIGILNDEGDWSAVCKQPRSTKSSPIASAPNQAAYVIYTSGSTGAPKGVLIEHHSLCNLVKSQQRALKIEPGDRLLQMASSSFDVSVWEIFTPLVSGATLCLATAEQLQPGPALIATLQKMQITIAAFPASVLASLPVSDLPELRTIVVGGERCSAELVALWSSGRQFINHYGPTESTVCATMHWCQADGQDPPIGRPIDNVQVYILDEDAKPPAPGEVGEIYLGGAGLARGYLNRPELTAKRFKIGLLPDAPGERLYRTGDLARFRDNGEIEFVGRVDHQIKLRGFRIELGEIEATLTSQPGVRQAAVILREDSPGVKRLVAYLSGTPHLDASELKGQLEARLPAFMIPAAFVTLESLPLTSHGKVDRVKLPPPESACAEDQEPACQNPLTQLLTEIWCDVLGLTSVGTNEHFVEVGGDSLLSVEIALRATTAGVPLESKDVLSKPTIAELAEFVQLRK